MNEFRDICYKFFKGCEDEADLNEIYDMLRDNLVCVMADRAEKLGIDPDTL